MRDLYRRTCNARLPHRQPQMASGCDEGCFESVACSEWSKDLDALAAAIGYGIDLQEAMDIVDLAVKGREGLSSFCRTLYDKAAQEIDDD